MLRTLILSLSLLLIGGCGEPVRFSSSDITGAAFGSEFPSALTDHTGNARFLSDFRGKVVVLFFGYLQCPDVCPTTLSGMAEAMKLLGNDAQKVQVLFVTVDPERDTQQLLAGYVPQFHPSFIGLRADSPTTTATAVAFKVFFQKQPGANAQSYTVDHSANSYVFDSQGRLRLYVKHGESSANIAGDIKRLLDGK